MEQKLLGVLIRWLEIDFYSVANKIGFIMQSKLPDKELMIRTIRCLDYATTKKNEKNINIHPSTCICNVQRWSFLFIVGCAAGYCLSGILYRRGIRILSTKCGQIQSLYSRTRVLFCEVHHVWGRPRYYGSYFQAPE